MEISTEFAFCSRGRHVKALEDGVHWFEYSEWENQFGSGTSYELHMVWFRWSFTIYHPIHPEPLHE
jgi:hypothetical protein